MTKKCYFKAHTNFSLYLIEFFWNYIYILPRHNFCFTALFKIILSPQNIKIDSIIVFIFSIFEICLWIFYLYFHLNILLQLKTWKIISNKINWIQKWIGIVNSINKATLHCSKINKFAFIRVSRFKWTLITSLYPASINYSPVPSVTLTPDHPTVIRALTHRHRHRHRHQPQQPRRHLLTQNCVYTIYAKLYQTVMSWKHV